MAVPTFALIDDVGYISYSLFSIVINFGREKVQQTQPLTEL